MKFTPFQDGKSGEMTHTTVKDHTSNCVRKTHDNGDDIATFIEKNNVDHIENAKPAPKEMGAVEKIDADAKALLMEQLKIEYQEEHLSW